MKNKAKDSKTKEQKIINKQKENPEEYFHVTDELDLHGFFPEQVPDIIEEFIWNAKRLKLQSLRIVHGKGKSKMKWAVHQVLKNHPDVKKFGDALPGSGNWGATIVDINLD